MADRQARVAAVWAGAGGRAEAEVLAEVQALVGQRPDDDPVARLELASACDFLGREDDAEPWR